MCRVVGKFVLFALLACVVASTDSGKLRRDVVQDVDQFISKQIERDNLPSLVVGIAVKNQAIYRKAWGKIDLENGRSATMESKYRLCSITKTYTSALVNRLVEQGRFTYHTPIHLILSEAKFPKKQWHGQLVNITVGELLSHTGGVHHTDIEHDFDSVTPAGDTNMIDKFKDLPLEFKPGTQYHYSNYGFQLLGAVVEAASNRTFVNVMRDFFQNNSLYFTFLETPDLMVSNRARYYTFNDNITENLPTLLIDQLVSAEGYYSSGGLISTLDDLIRFGQLMIDAYHGKPNAILSQKTIREMWTPRTHDLSRDKSKSQYYGYGWKLVNATSLTHLQSYVFHDGGLFGASTMLMLFPDHQIVGVAMTNKGDIDLDQMVLYAAHKLYIKSQP